MELGARDRKVFVNALLNPPKPSGKLRKAAKEYLDVVNPLSTAMQNEPKSGG